MWTETTREKYERNTGRGGVGIADQIRSGLYYDATDKLTGKYDVLKQ